LINSQQESPDIKHEQVMQSPDLTDDTRPQREAEKKFGLSIPLVTGLVAIIFIVIVAVAILTS